MIEYEWRLKTIGKKPHVIKSGTVKANSQNDAVDKLNNELNIQPHTGEILEIIEPETFTNPSAGEPILT